MLVGTAASRAFSAPRFAGALIVALSMQVGVNFANDYFDAVKGVDTSERLGPRRLTAAGIIAPRAMRLAMVLSFAIAVLCGLALAAAAGWELAGVGAVSILAALGYSGGPWPYGERGLGEVFVFVFFGLVATVGSAYVQTGRIAAAAFAASVPVGLLASAILVANNLRDIDTDARTGKGTLAVKLGPGRTQLLYRAMLAGAYASAGVAAWASGRLWALLPLASLPLALPLLRRIRSCRGPQLISVLNGTARLQLAFGLLLAGGLWI